MMNSLYRFLASLGYTDPLHAPLTHFPIGLVFGALIFFLVAVIFRRQRLVLTARHASILAFVMVFPTILFGVFDWLHFYNGALINPIKWKIGLAAFTLVVLAVGIIVGDDITLGRTPEDKAATSRAGLSAQGWVTLGVYLLAFFAVVGLGWFGARLVPGVYAKAAAAPALSSSTAPANAMAAVSPQNGQSIFADNCSSCHPDGTNIIVSNLPIKGSKRLAALATFSAFVRAPTMPDGKTGQMPDFGRDVLSDAQIADLYAYIAQTWK